MTVRESPRQSDFVKERCPLRFMVLEDHSARLGGPICLTFGGS